MRAIRLRAFSNEKDQISWLVDGILADIGWTLLIGKQGLGKSTFALQLCNALQSGIPFLGRDTKRTDVLYVQADSPTVEWREMVRRVSPLSEGYTCVDVEPQCLDNPSYVGALGDLIRKVKPGFLVWDSLYNLTATSLNNDNVREPINVIKGLSGRAPWLLIHHPPHGETRAAGHHSLAANCSNEWRMLKSKLEIAKGRLVAERELRMSRGDDGLWYPEGTDDGLSGYGALMSAPI